MKVWIALLLFIVYVVEDIAYVRYFQSVTAKRAMRASVYSVLIYAISIFGVLSYVNNPWYALPVLAGSAAGTFIAVRWGQE